MSSQNASNLEELSEQWLRGRSLRERISARIGLQGKLTLCFIFLLSLAVGGSCWLFASQSAARVTDIVSEQARQISSALAVASEDDIHAQRIVELTRVSQDLIKSQNVMFAGFFGPDFKPVALASRDPNFAVRPLGVGPQRTEALACVRRGTSPVFGDYLEVITPVLSVPSGADRTRPTSNGPRLLGFVAVGMSEADEAAQLTRITLLVLAIGAALIVVSVPLGYVLVRRLFQPIRELVAATNRIIAGDLDARVAIHRPDVIGVLSRSFNEMVIRVKSQQLALENANHDLEGKVEQRTAQLAMANKRLSGEIAEKEDFLRAVSHDLNAPLRNISGMAAMLLMKHREKFDEDVIHRLERIQKNVEVETDLITELLELSRIKTRRQKMEVVAVEPLVLQVRDLFEEDLNRRAIDFVIDTPLPSLNCEPARMRQVFQNLFDNAIKYMGDGPEKSIHVGCTIRETEAEFYVRDTGIGIDPEDIDKVFYVFRRGKNSAESNVPGKGVGLASVKSIIETYNGRIYVESVKGRGSTFHFTINGGFVSTLKPENSARLPDDPAGAAQEQRGFADMAIVETAGV